MFVTKPVKFAALAAITALALAGSLAHAQQGFLIRDSDKLHLDVRQVVNTEARPQKISFVMELCMARKTADGSAPKQAVCKSIDESKLIEVPAKEQGQPSAIVRFKEDAQTKRRTGTEINKMAQDLVAASGLKAEDVLFRLGLNMLSHTERGLVKIDTDYSSFPALTQEAPAEERGLLISRQEPANTTKSVTSRVLLVITRRGQ